MASTGSKEASTVPIRFADLRMVESEYITMFLFKSEAPRFGSGFFCM